MLCCHLMTLFHLPTYRLFKDTVSRKQARKVFRVEKNGRLVFVFAEQRILSGRAGAVQEISLAGVSVVIFCALLSSCPAWPQMLLPAAEGAISCMGLRFPRDLAHF